MIIKELEMTNLRSHEHTTIRVPLGKTLFEGDVGSGKSTILMAIEFALFGLGSESGTSLLRLGKEQGGVSLKFEVEGREFVVVRGLERKGGSVRQTEGRLSTPEEDLYLSPRELKEKILEVLQFNEAPETKAQSLIYRYAVYTPQEEMKAVLSMSPDVRLQTLRRAFRVEDYKTATENSSEIGRGLRGDVRELEGKASGLERVRQQMGELAMEIDKQKSSLEIFRASESKTKEELARLMSEQDMLRREQLKMEKLRSEKFAYDKLEKDETRKISSLKNRLSGLEDKVSRLQLFLKARKAARGPSRPNPVMLRAKERSSENEVRRLTGLKATLESKLADYGTIMDKGVCPVCDRPVEIHAFAQRAAYKEDERVHAADALVKAEASLTEIRRQRELADDYSAGKREAIEKRREVSELKKEVRQLKADVIEAEGELRSTRKALEELEAKSDEMVEASIALAATEKGVDRSRDELQATKDKIARTEERIHQLGSRKDELGLELRTKEGAALKRGILSEKELWLADYFEPTVQLIERSVLGSINQEFDSLFQRWFVMLAGDPEKEASVDEDFTPYVTQGGYEQDVGYLSGGERTSVALAYRLALNSIVRRVSTHANSNLVILDEPTDGFSQEQLGNLREVLDDLGSTQVILVSHDRELESFVDQILRVTKTQGVSVVEPSTLS